MQNIKTDADGYWKAGDRYLHLWSSGANMAGDWTYIWAHWSSDAAATLSYRIVTRDREVVSWTAFVDVDAVFRKTKYVEEAGSIDDAPPPLGGAEHLPAGRYRLEVRVVIASESLVFEAARPIEVEGDDPLLR